MSGQLPDLGAPLRVSRQDALARLVDALADTPCPAVTAAELDATLQLRWRPCWLVDAQVRGAWTAKVVRGGRLHQRAGYLDLWLDGVVVCADPDVPPGLPTPPAPAARVAIDPSSGGRPTAAFGEAQAIATERLGHALSAAIARATSARAVQDMDADLERLQHTAELFAHPVWWATCHDDTGATAVIGVDGVSGELYGDLPSSLRRARLRAAAWLAAGLLCLASSAALVLPGLLLWPLLAVSLVGGAVGFAAIGYAPLPLLATRAHQAAAAGATVLESQRPEVPE